MRTRLAALALCAIIHGASSQAVMQDTQPPRQNTQRTDSNQCRCKAPPRGTTIDNSSRTINSAITANATVKQQNRFQTNGQPRTLSRNVTPIIVTDDGETAYWTKLIYRATAVLGGITALLAVFTFFLWRGAGETAEHELRPYVSWYSVEPPSKDPETFTMGREFTFKNYGKTPASFVQIWVSQMVDVIGGPNLPEPNFTIGGQYPVLMPDQVTPPLRVQFMSTDDEKRQVEAGTHRHFVFGAIEYKDVFGATNTLRMRWVLKGSTLFLSEGGNSVTYGVKRRRDGRRG